MDNENIVGNNEMENTTGTETTGVETETDNKENETTGKENETTGTKTPVMTLAIIIALIAIIAIPFGIKHEQKRIQDNNLSQVETVSENTNTIDLNNIVNEVTTDHSEIETISDTASSQQSEEVLTMLNIDKADVTNYSLCVDPSNDKGYAIAIIKPKEEAYDECKTALINYVGNKQYILGSIYNNENSEVSQKEKEIAENATILEDSGYLILVMAEDNDNILNSIRHSIDKELSKMMIEQ